VIYNESIFRRWAVDVPEEYRRFVDRGANRLRLSSCDWLDIEQIATFSVDEPVLDIIMPFAVLGDGSCYGWLAALANDHPDTFCSPHDDEFAYPMAASFKDSVRLLIARELVSCCLVVQERLSILQIVSRITGLADTIGDGPTSAFGAEIMRALEGPPNTDKHGFLSWYSEQAAKGIVEHHVRPATLSKVRRVRDWE
jgi:hypothetical protein